MSHMKCTCVTAQCYGRPRRVESWQHALTLQAVLALVCSTQQDYHTYAKDPYLMAAKVLACVLQFPSLIS
jgi:hypothetical protein